MWKMWNLMALSGEKVTIRDFPHRINVCLQVCPPKSFRGFPWKVVIFQTLCICLKIFHPVQSLYLSDLVDLGEKLSCFLNFTWYKGIVNKNKTPASQGAGNDKNRMNPWLYYNSIPPYLENLIMQPTLLGVEISPSVRGKVRRAIRRRNTLHTRHDPHPFFLTV